MVFAVNDFMRRPLSGGQVDDRLVILRRRIAANDVVLGLRETVRARGAGRQLARMFGIEERNDLGFGRLKQINHTKVDNGGGVKLEDEVTRLAYFVGGQGRERVRNG